MLKEFYLKYRIFIIPSVVGLICLTILLLVIIPQMLDFFKEREKVGIVLNRIELLENKASNLESLNSDKLEKDLETALIVLPTGRDVPQAMAVLQELVARSNLTLKSTSYSTNTNSKASDQNSFSFSISVAGSLESTRNFLNSLRDAARVFKIESISLKFQPEDNSVLADIPLSVFFQPAPATALTPDQPVAKFGEKENALIESLAKYSVKPVIESTSSSVPLGKLDLFQ